MYKGFLKWLEDRNIDVNQVDFRETIEQNVVINGDLTVSGSAKTTGLGPENEIVIVGSDNALTSSNLLTIDSTNERIGIGTTNPSVKLDMVGEAIKRNSNKNGSTQYGWRRARY